ncbi:hypothetical protein EVJ50_00365 [Synechococcus sp. RSCCF101]|uniref:ABC transporter substrate-binding protein n=1 Tax=Synechococcus sp. RSCCF101 TaxID=2511069 RepID=UPI001249273B|nr:ABC transporter substrate-binding protein [Synechococcus sp. RSCCF101]QEY30939.1 hypothetical protein EVJ50_00365 [Synechococcus sp. RSCCF101]
MGSAISRRRLLQLMALSGAASLLGCGRAGEAAAPPRLGSVRGQLPRTWLQRLPDPWISTSVDTVGALTPDPPAPFDLLALSDGWALEDAARRWQPPAAPALRARLAPWVSDMAGPALPEVLLERALPVGVSPWVIVHRLPRRSAPPPSEGWGMLLDPELQGSLVLPSSPRVVMALAERLPNGLEDLPRLRRQAFSHDERHALNLLLAGEVLAAVCQLRWLVPLLRSDHRLQVLLPEQGTVLGWTVLVRPTGSPEPLPQPWVDAAWEPPLLARLARGGWLPPLPPGDLRPALATLPEELAAWMAPSPALLRRCVSLGPLDPEERQRLQRIWDAAAPPAGLSPRGGAWGRP